MRTDAILGIPAPSGFGEFIKPVVDVHHLALAFLLLILGVNLRFCIAPHRCFQIINQTLRLLYCDIGSNHIALMLGSLLGGKIHGTLLHIALALLGKFNLL